MTRFSEVFWNRIPYVIAFGGAGLALVYFLAGEPEVAQGPAGTSPAPQAVALPAGESLAAPYPDGATTERVSVPAALVPVIETKQELQELHRQLETEPTDSAWSEAIETRIIEHFAAMPALEPLTVLGVECRTTLCEVQLMLNDAAAFAGALAEMMAFHDESWHDLETVDLNGQDIGQGRMGIVWLLQRPAGD